MNLIEKAINGLAPQWGAKRARARALVAHYDAATVGRRASSLRADRTDADAASRGRARIAWYARDMVRNTPFAARAQAVIAGNVVGDGIIPKITFSAVNGRKPSKAVQKRLLARGLDLIERHLDTTAIDRQGQTNLYGLQRQIINTVVDAGECLIRVFDNSPTGVLPLQLDVLEPDLLDTAKVGFLEDGSEIREGIEYDAEGNRVAYWLFPRHPGGDWSPGDRLGLSERVPARLVMHVYRIDRPGQQRGVSWFAPVMMRLQDLADHEDAQLMRQKIAACFAAFTVFGEGSPGADRQMMPETIEPGMIYNLGDGEDVRFSAPPGVEGYDEFTRSVLRSVAAGLGISYESLTGDLSQVNFSSARMGRLEMDTNVSSWQWLMLVPQFLNPLGRLFCEAWASVDEPKDIDAGKTADVFSAVRMDWVPPRKIIVDPAREFAALGEAVRMGLFSWQQVVRQLGNDPERLLEERSQDQKALRDLGLSFDSLPAPASVPAESGDIADVVQAMAATLGLSGADLAAVLGAVGARANQKRMGIK